ncbi:putative sulfotransferase 1C2A [Apostichopus japonicus]|uniref:Putative sulfotransferase 1C2A n=1 Tax=Stichopus japonicus TaxID=307972 RepID=A0A2G8JZN6_STIJA|nr:putative sulfotransferase 1C2A [Apostichopus japonicus]
MSSPRVIKSHLKPHNLPRDMKVKAPKVIYVARNAKDTAVSAYNFCKLLPGLPTLEEWPDFFEHFCKGTGFKRAVSTISEFLERSLSEESLDLIVNNSTFSAMRSNPKTNPDLNPGELNKIPAQFFRKGKVGDWKNYFTVAQNESFDVLYTEKLRGSDLTFEFEPSHL